MVNDERDGDSLWWWLTLLGLALYGVFFVYSTGYISAEYPVREVWTRHALWLAVGAAVLVGVSRLAPGGRGAGLLIWLGYAFSLLGLVAVLLLGTKIGGARRWLSLGGQMIQPAEFAKVFTLLAVARVLGTMKSGWRYALAVALVGVPLGLIIVEPSVGNALSLLPGMAVAMGSCQKSRRLWQAMLCLALVVCVGGTSSVLWLRAHGGAEVVTADKGGGLIRDYHWRRMGAYLTPGGSWNERQSVMTLASGGAFGKGYLEGTMKGLGYLPRTVAPTDFIFAVIGEEMGFFFGTLPVMLLYIWLVWLGLRWSMECPDEVTRLASASLTTLLATHVLVNIAMTVRLLPVIGLPLPLLSYGGSFTLAVAIALGVIRAAGKLRSREPEALSEAVSASTPRQWTLPLIPRIFHLHVVFSDARADSQSNKRSGSDHESSSS